MLALLTPHAAAQTEDRSIWIGEKLSLHSIVLKEDRPYWVFLPDSYKHTLDVPRRYPVLCLLDGDAHFQCVSRLVKLRSAGINANRAIPELIIVAIPNSDRTRDLTG